MDALQKNVAIARGEALAASLLASVALQTLFAIISNKQETADRITAFIDDSLNLSAPARATRTMNSTRRCVKRRGSRRCSIWMPLHG